jgi:hypothetical protein
VPGAEAEVDFGEFHVLIAWVPGRGQCRLARRSRDCMSPTQVWQPSSVHVSYEKEFDYCRHPREYTVPPPARNVIPFNPKAAADDLPISLARLRSAVCQFGELRHYAERMANNPQWSAMDWRATCSPLLIRLPRARQSLADLDPIRVGRCADTGWAARIRNARCEVERRLTNIRISMSALTSAEVSNSDAVVAVSSDATRLAAALGDLGTLIASRYPAVAGDGNDR